MASLLRSLSRVSGMTFISRILGFLRDMLAAQYFGAGAAVDAFYIAFKIPNFMRNLFAEGAFSQAFVPILSEYKEKNSFEETHTFIRHVSGSLIFILLIITILGITFSPVIIHIFSIGLDPLRYHYATEMLRITFSYLMLISLTAFCGSILNCYGYFSIPAFTPALLNILLIFTAVFIAPHLTIPVFSQAYGVLIAGLVQLIFQWPLLIKLKLFPWPKLNWTDPGVKRILKMMVPALFGASVTNLSLLLNTIFASFLQTGSIAWLYYSDRLAYLPLGVFGVALATVVLPHLSKKHATASETQFCNALDWGIRCNLLVAIPCMLALYFFAAPMIITLFQHGVFKPYDALMTEKSVMAYAVGLPAFMLVKVLSVGFYAKQNIRTPVKIAAVSMLANMLLNAIFIIPFHHVGLALATSLAAWINAILLAIKLWQKNILRFQASWKTFFKMAIPANIVLGFILYFAAGSPQYWLNESVFHRTSNLAGWLMFAALAYTFILYIMGFRLRSLREVH